MILRIAAHERQVHPGATLSLVGHLKAQDLIVEPLHPVAVMHIDAHVGQSGVDFGHAVFLLPGTYAGLSVPQVNRRRRLSRSPFSIRRGTPC
jgi:hypothetical protein